MRFLRTTQRWTAGLTVVFFCLICVLSAPAKAAMIDTATAIKSAQNDQLRQKVMAFFDRRDVQKQLTRWGVKPEEAKARVKALTDDEVRLLAKKIDQMPAGGDGLGFLIGVLIIAFIVLIILDIMGITDVFTFIKKKR